MIAISRRAFCRSPAGSGRELPDVFHTGEDIEQVVEGAENIVGILLLFSGVFDQAAQEPVEFANGRDGVEPPKLAAFLLLVEDNIDSVQESNGLRRSKRDRLGDGERLLERSLFAI